MTGTILRGSLLSRGLTFTATLGLIAAAVQACAVDVDVFGPGVGGDDPSSSSTGGAPSTSSAGGAPNGSTSSVGGTTSSAGGTTSVGQTASSSATSSSSSGGGGCLHDLCAEGPPLMSGCDPCVTQVCQEDAFCCDTTWDAFCVESAQKTCGLDCAPGLPSCEQQYGMGPGYYGCSQSATECLMGANMSLQSCGTICASGGGECLGGFNNQGMCGFGQSVGCGFIGFQTGLCLCSRGCGGGAPCGSGQFCLNGACI